jgi:hypothetical protein
MNAFLVLEVVDHAGRDVIGLRVVRDLPNLLDVLQRGDEALARRGVVDGGNARTVLPSLSVTGRILATLRSASRMTRLCGR